MSSFSALTFCFLKRNRQKSCLQNVAKIDFLKFCLYGAPYSSLKKVVTYNSHTVRDTGTEYYTKHLQFAFGFPFHWWLNRWCCFVPLPLESKEGCHRCGIWSLFLLQCRMDYTQTWWSSLTKNCLGNKQLKITNDSFK